MMRERAAFVKVSAIGRILLLRVWEQSDIVVKEGHKLQLQSRQLLAAARHFKREDGSMQGKRKFRVAVTWIDTYVDYYTVEADSEDEALEKAEDQEGDFDEDESVFISTKCLDVDIEEEILEDIDQDLQDADQPQVVSANGHESVVVASPTASH